MTAPTIRQIRAGLGTRLDTIAGLRVHDTVPGQFSPPAAIVGMPSRPNEESMARDRYNIDVWIVVARQADAQSEKSIEQYLNPTGATSVRAAVYGDKTLGGAVDDVYETNAEATTFTFGSDDQPVTYLGLEFTFRITARGKD